jgi:DeoR family fructose operon transcriptional repressor
MASNGLSVDRGLTTPDSAEAMVKRAAIASARRTVLLADHTKVGNDHFARFANLSDIDTFITDAGIDSAVGAEIAAAGPILVTA